MSPAPDPFPRPTPLLTEAEQLARPQNELAGAAPIRCAGCNAPPDGASIRVVMQEIHFTCARGHWNALGSSEWAEAA